MKVRVTFLKLHCVDDSDWEWGKDEVYFAVFPVLVRKDGSQGEKKELGGALSTIKGKVKKGTVWLNPTLTNHSSSFEIEADDAEALSMALFCYEADNKSHYNALKENPLFSKAGVPRTDWKKILEFKPASLTSLSAWAGSAYKAAVFLFKEFQQDDPIGRKPIGIKLDDAHAFGVREIEFKGSGADYKLALSIERV